MSNFIEIYKPGEIVIPFWLSEEPNRYELNGIGLEKSIELIEKMFHKFVLINLHKSIVRVNQ